MSAVDHPSRAGRWWGETWRFLLALLMSLTVLGLLVGARVSGYEENSRWWFVEAGAGIAAFVLLFLRRRRPLPVALVGAALTAVAVSATAPAAVCFISVATRRRTREIAGLAVAWALAAVAFEIVHPSRQTTLGDRVTSAFITALGIAVCIAAGLAIGARRELLASLRRQVASAAEQERARVQQAQLAERARIAREMHDVLAHRISLVAMHAGALAYRTDLPPEQVREAAGVIRDSSRLALTELREVLGVLREDRPDAVEPPQPTLGAVRDLAAATPETDGPIDLHIDGDLDGVPDLLSRSAFRIVQEAITNRRKHAYGQPLELVLRRADDRLLLRAGNPTTSAGDPERGGHDLPASGLGLTGLTERVTLAGGSMTYGVDRSGRFVLTATLPIRGTDEEDLR